jgi:TRAP-type transport system small permease protein
MPTTPGSAGLTARTGSPLGLLVGVVTVADRCAAVLAVAAMASLVVVVSTEVALRYLFSESIFFASELARLCFVWLVFLALPLALGRGRHVGIDAIDRVLPEAAARVAIRAGAVAVIGLLVIVCQKSVDTMLFNWDQQLDTMPLSAGLFYLPVPVAAAHAILHMLVQLIDGRRTPLAPEHGQ